MANVSGVRNAMAPGSGIRHGGYDLRAAGRGAQAHIICERGSAFDIKRGGPLGQDAGGATCGGEIGWRWRRSVGFGRGADAKEAAGDVPAGFAGDEKVEIAVVIG